jgi:hypothetical protein
MLVTSGLDFINKRNPNVNFIYSFYPSAPMLKLSNNSFPFLAFQLLDSTSNPISDETYINFEPLYYIKDQLGPRRTPMTFVSCKEKYKYFSNSKFNFTNNYEINKLNISYCLNETDLKIGGSWADNNFFNINIRVKKCVNETKSPVVCKNQTQIEDKIRGANFEFFYADTYIDSLDYANPFKYYFANYYFKINSKQSKFVDIYFKNTTLSDDDGPFGWWEGLNNRSNIRFDYSRPILLHK